MIVPTPDMETSEWLDYWLDEHVSMRRPNTLKFCTNAVVRASAAIGDIPLSYLRPSDMQDLVNTMKVELAPLTVIRYFGAIKRAMSVAVAYQLLPTNPCGAATLPKDRHKVPFVNPRDMQAVIREIRDFPKWRARQLKGNDHLLRLTMLAAFYETVLTTGMRYAEAAGLCAENVEFQHGVLHIVEQLERGGKRPVWSPVKSRRANRSLAVPDSTAALLMRLGEMRQRMQLRSPENWVTVRKGPVFVSQRGTPINNSTANGHLGALFERVGLPKVTLHGLRHSYMVYQIDQGASLVDVSRLAGHATYNMTETQYGHLHPSQAKSAANRMNSLLTPKGLDSNL